MEGGQGKGVGVPGRQDRQDKVLEPLSPRRPWAPWGSSGLSFRNINRGMDDVQNRTAAQDVLQITRVPTRDPTGADFAGVPRKRFWLQRCAFLATGSERVPTGADCASRSDSSSRTGLVTNHAGADAGADGYRLRRRAAETRLAAAPCVSCSGIRAGADGCRLRHPNHSPTSTPPSVRAQRSMLCLRDRDFPISIRQVRS